MRLPSWQRLAVAALVAVVAIGIPFVLSDFQTLNISYALIFAIAILGLNILTGFSGQISLGHGAFIAIGAYTAAILEKRFGWNPVATIPVAAVLCGVIGFGIGVPALRLEGIYLALATFALGVAAPTILKKPEGLTGGVRGIILPPFKSPTDAFTDDKFFYVVVLACTLVLFLVAHNLLRSRTGRAWRAIRDGELAATAFGVNRAYYKTIAFAVSAAYGGVAGALYGIATGFVSADAYPFQLSIALLVGGIVGGIATLEGALIGGLLSQYLPIYSQQLLLPVSKQLANAAPGVTQGVLLLLIMFAARDGAAGLLRTGYARIRRAVRGEQASTADQPVTETAL